MGTLEGHRSLDVREMWRQGYLKPGIMATMSWSRRGEPWGNIGYVAGTDKITLRYKYQRYDQAWEDVKQEIFLEWTSCNYGGRRPWFTCRCGRRVALLYCAGRYFLCRKCYGLIHASVNEGKKDRVLRKMQNIRKLLGGTMSLADLFPRKPKGMHQRTYQRWRWRYGAAEERYWVALALMLEKMRLRTRIKF